LCLLLADVGLSAPAAPSSTTTKRVLASAAAA
jgi:hypothetical protein